ncbi:sensor histidine kinase [Mahella sp.]|uniref:sensor histidine kinase n=1 Tax=Mahella sp. TaxID=2798721 RepID=UPI0025C6DC4B|nr:sensor histidine kinase [Mahella sp.]MBZ4666799.1 integral rane sensor signal transduction histidine kinase [Mahella sp.]
MRSKGIFRMTGIRREIFLYYLIVIIIMSGISILSYYNAKNATDRMSGIFADYMELNDLYSGINSLEAEVEKYLSTRSSDALLNYYTLYNELESKSHEMTQDYNYDAASLMMKDIGNMIQNLLIKTDDAVNAKRARNSGQYIKSFTEANQIAGYIELYINELLYNNLDKGAAQYSDIARNVSYISYLEIFLISGSMALSLFLAVYLTGRITSPLIALSHSAEKVSEGDFDVEPLNDMTTNDEVKVLADAFARMLASIKEYIREIKEQAELKTQLKEAELKALQAQINPHFLFNTLNAASQLAMMEGADKSSEFIEKVASLFRYNLRQTDQPVTLKDEIGNVRNYMYILKTRFGDKVDFEIYADEAILDYKIPVTIIQPVVENAFIHGIEDIEGKGFIKIEARYYKPYIYVKVTDNGKGMDRDTIIKILSLDKSDGSSSIGLHNVIKRLMLFYDVDNVRDVIEIYSEEGKGTIVTLKLPMEGDKP